MKKIVLISIGSVIVLGSVLYFGFYNGKDLFRKESSANSANVSDGYPGSLNMIQERKRWARIIDEVGTEKAYEQFKAEYQNRHFGIQHTAAHIIGELIYKEDGIKGLAVCDATFSFGCYHSFFGQALAAKGIDVIPELDARCIEKFSKFGTGCQHGIGHGLMEYYGNGKLLDALNACKKTTQEKALFGCTSGVFMEYNVPIVISANDAKTEPRIINKDHPYEPCDSLPQEFQESCYYEMAQWWDKPLNFEKDYHKIGQLCLAIKDEKSREACYLGAGNVAAPSSEYDVQETIKKCNEMPTKEYQRICRSGASWSFFSSGSKYRNLSAKVCEGLDQDSRHICVQESDLIGTGEINRQ